MKILYVTHQYLPRWVGGVEIYTHALAQALIAHGHRVEVFVVEDEAGGLLNEDYQGVRVHRFRAGSRSETRRWLAVLGETPTHVAFEQVLDELRPDVVHVQHLMGLPAALCQAIKLRQIPLVITLHDYGFVCANTKLLTNDTEQVCGGPQAYINCARCGLAKAGFGWGWPLAPVVAPIFALRAQSLLFALKQADWLIAPTSFVRDTHARLGAPLERLQVIDYGIHVSPDPVIPLRPSGPLRVAFVGSVARLKGVHVLVEAFNRLPPEAELRVAGDLSRQPDYVAGLRQSSHHPQVHLLGPLNRAETWALLDWADVVAVPSIWYEVSPLVIHEAFARRRPVLTSNLGSMATCVRHTVDGLLIAPNDPLAWATALSDLAVNRAKLLALAAGIQPIKSMPQHMIELETVYQSFLG